MNTVKIRKKNRIKLVSADRVEAFLKQGYDQIDEAGNIERRATGGRTISIAEHNKALDELEKQKKENATLKGKLKRLEKEKPEKESKQ